MTSKTSAVRSIRLQNDLWARLAKEAERRGVAVNGLVVDLLEVALLRAAEAVAIPAPPRAAPRPKPAKPAAEPFKTRLKGEWKAP